MMVTPAVLLTTISFDSCVPAHETRSLPLTLIYNWRTQRRLSSPMNLGTPYCSTSFPFTSPSLSHLQIRVHGCLENAHRVFDAWNKDLHFTWQVERSYTSSSTV